MEMIRAAVTAIIGIVFSSTIKLGINRITIIHINRGDSRTGIRTTITTINIIILIIPRDSIMDSGHGRNSSRISSFLMMMKYCNHKRY